MSGHSKWSTIKHKKGKADAQRGKLFTKLARYITVAVKEGGPDPEYNNNLKNAIEKAKEENMPNDNIERAIKKGSGDLDGANFEEITYEGYGPGGVAVFVECLTDNRNRTASDVRHAFDKFGGNLGSTGCVSWMFDRKGLLIVNRDKEVDEDELMLKAIDAGADDFSAEDEYFEIITAPESYEQVKESLKEEGYNFSTSEVTYLPQNETKLEEEKDIKNMVKLIDALEDSDDVQEVFHNWDMPEDLDI
ncbi:YebC/PmpR family DNA-binding transcriptional regulator [Proteiniborus sp.]|uniref:YebC/PmpR family DNA-binding transcriptional regulator n=1 Tax=Proteiniborus sp. TaxID=2079015 RepID=UPI003320978D